MRAAATLALCVLATIATSTTQASSVHIKVSNGVIADGAEAGIATASKDSLAAVVIAGNPIETESTELDASDSDSESDDTAEPATEANAPKHLRQVKLHTKGYYQYCGIMTGRKLSDVKYVCSWKKNGNYNIFFERPDGTIEFECSCLDDISGTYGSVFWSNRHHSKDSDVECFSSDKREAADLRQEFKEVSCKGTLYQSCVKKPGQDAKCKYFSQSHK